MSDQQGGSRWRNMALRLFVACTLLGPGIVRAQAPGQPPVTTAGAAASDPKSREIADRRAELRGLEDTIDAADTQRRNLESDIQAIRTDRARLNTVLIQPTAKNRQSEIRAVEAQKRRAGLEGQ